MRYIITLIFTLFSIITLLGQSAFISEIHYDDVMNPDSFEFVEVYVPGIVQPTGAELYDYRITLYQGTDGIFDDAGEVHRFKSLAEFDLFMSTPNGGYYVVEFPDTTYAGFTFGGIENDYEGIAFTGPGNVVYDFLSYEGGDDANGDPNRIIAVEGAAIGAISSPITSGNGESGVYVQENSATATTRSLQQNGFGAWTYNVPFSLALENTSNSETGFSGNVPVELMTFIGRSRQDGVHLKWTTASEISNDYFEIRHSIDGRNYSLVCQIDGVGDSFEEENYNFLHKDPVAGYNYYKLVQYDTNGDHEEVGNIIVNRKNAKSVVLYPSSTANEINLRGVDEESEIEIYNTNGSLQFRSTYENGTLDVSHLIPGVYFLKVSDQVLKFTKI